jgi:hypothetical protein
MDQKNLSSGIPFREPPHTLVVTTDASDVGWGVIAKSKPSRDRGRLTNNDSISTGRS